VGQPVQTPPGGGESARRGEPGRWSSARVSTSPGLNRVGRKDAEIGHLVSAGLVTHDTEKYEVLPIRVESGGENVRT
jgi:hypothetical protein